MKFLQGSRQLAVTSLAVLVVLLLSLSWALADTSPPLEEWSRTFGGSNFDGGRSVQQTSDGGYIITGDRDSFGFGGPDVYLVKTDSQGREKWSSLFGGDDTEDGYSVQETSDGGYIITGITDSFGAGGYDVYLVKADSQGLEEETYSVSVVDLEAPYEVYVGESFTVELTVSYEFTVPTETRTGIYDVEAGTWVAEEYETLVGAGTQAHSFELTAPEEATTWALRADVWYYSEGEWIHDVAYWSELFDIQVREEETYSASVVDLVAPSEVYVGEIFTVEATVSYEFTVPTEMRPGIYDVEAGTWIAEEYETLVGAGTQTYSFELTAPDERMTWELEADVFYRVEDTWLYDEGSSMFFSVEVVSGCQGWWDCLLELPFEYLIIIGLLVLILLILLLKWIF